MNEANFFRFKKSKTKARRIQALLLSVIIIFQSVTFAERQETSQITSRLDTEKVLPSATETPVQEVRSSIGKLKTLKKFKQPWLYGAHLDDVFYQVGQKLNLISFLSQRQRVLLQADPKRIALELSLVSKEGYIGKMKAPQFLVSGVQTYLLAFVITAMALVKEDLYVANVTGKTVNPADTMRPIAESGEKMLLSVDMILNLFTASGLGFLASPVMKPVVNFIESTKNARVLGNAFRNLLVNLVHSSISFLGWEFGSRFLQQSLNLLDDQLKTKEEREFLENRGQIFKHIYFALANPQKVPPEKIAAAQKVLSLIISNAANVLSIEELRWQWIYNTYRLNLLNGNFFTVLFSMASGAAVGNSLLPGAGLIWGSVFGLGGGALSLLVPERIKYAMTLDLNQKALSVNKILHENTTSTYLLAGFDDKKISNYNSNLTFDQVLQNRVNYREFIVDSIIERIHYSLSQFTTNDELFERMLKAKNESNSQRIAFEVDTLRAQNREHYLRLVESLRNAVFLYLDEASFFNALLKNKKLNSAQFELEEEMTNVELVYRHFCDLSKNLLLVSNQTFKSAKSNQVEVIMRNTCAIEEFNSAESILQLNSKDSQLYAAALKFIETKYASGFSEQRLSIDRATAVYSIKSESKE